MAQWFKLEIYSRDQSSEEEVYIPITKGILDSVKGYNNGGFKSLIGILVIHDYETVVEDMEEDLFSGNPSEETKSVTTTVDNVRVEIMQDLQDISFITNYYMRKSDYDSLLDIPVNLTDKQIQDICDQVFYEENKENDDFAINVKKLVGDTFGIAETILDEEVDRGEEVSDFAINMLLYLVKNKNVDKLELLQTFVKDELVGDSDTVKQILRNIKKYITDTHDLTFMFVSTELLDMFTSLSQNKPLFFEIFYKETYYLKVPVLKSSDMTTRLFATVRAINWLQSVLRSYKVSSADIKELIKRAKNDLRTSLAKPGTSAGVLVGEALGSLNTQATLNTFHSSGQDTSATMNTNSYSDILGASNNPTNININMSFKNKQISYDEAYRKRSDIIGIKISDLISPDKTSNIEIETLDVLGGIQWWHEWQLTYGDTQEDIDTNEVVLRLHFDIDRLYTQNIELDFIARKIDESAQIIQDNLVDKNEEKSKHALLRCFYSPNHEGIIDVYPQRSIVLSLMEKRYSCDRNPRSCVELFLKVFVYDQIKSMCIKGVEGIIGLYPQVDPVLQVVLAEVNINDPSIKNISLDENIEDPNNLWVIFFSRTRMRLTGLKPENLAYLYNLVGIKSLAVNYEAGYMVVESSDKPSKITLDALKDEKDKIKAAIEKRRKQGIVGYMKYERTELMLAAEYVYLILKAEPKSKNILSKLMCKPYVDQNHTYSSNTHELTQLFGVESSFNYIYTTLNTISASGGGVGFRNTDLVAAQITRNGRPRGLKGNKGGGFFSSASFGKAYTSLVSAASLGAKESMENPVTSIGFGQRVKLGTGYNYKERVKNTTEFLDYQEESNLASDEVIMEQQTFLPHGVDTESELIASINNTEMMKFESLFNKHNTGLKRNVIIDNVPVFVAPRARDLRQYTKSIEMFLEENSDFVFSDDTKFDDVRVDLPRSVVKRVLENIVVQTSELDRGGNDDRIDDDYSNFLEAQKLFG